MKMSRVLLDRRAIRGRKLDSGYSLHQLVYGMFPGEDRVLFQATQKEGVLEVLVKHERDPVPTEGVAVSTKTYRLPGEGSLVAFEVLVNATQVKTLETGRKTRVPVADVKTWVGGKLGGIQVLSLETETSDPIQAKGCTFPVTRVMGRGVVADATKLGALVASGIGREKAFGCGMLKVWNINS